MNGPKLWQDILDAVNIPGAVIAGGCIRDCFLHVEPKDIDVFVPCSSLEHWKEVKYPLLVNNSSLRDLRDTQEGQEYDKTDFSREKNPLYGVLEGEVLGHPVNIIARTSHTDPDELISLFDFGILQAFYDGKTVRYTEAHLEDMMCHRATLTHDKHIEQSLNRFLRFNARYPGLLSLNIPYEYQINVQT